MKEHAILRAFLRGGCLGGGALALMIGAWINHALPEPAAVLFGGPFFSQVGIVAVALWLPAKWLLDRYERGRG